MVERFHIFLIACNIRSDTCKKALLLPYVGEEVHDISNLCPPAHQKHCPSTKQLKRSSMLTSLQKSAQLLLSIVLDKRSKMPIKVCMHFTPDSNSCPNTAASRTLILKSRARSFSLQCQPVCENMPCCIPWSCPKFSSQDGCSKTRNATSVRLKKAPTAVSPHFCCNSTVRQIVSKHWGNIAATRGIKTWSHLFDKLTTQNNATRQTFVATVEVSGYIQVVSPTAQHGTKLVKLPTKSVILRSYAVRCERQFKQCVMTPVQAEMSMLL